MSQLWDYWTDKTMNQQHRSDQPLLYRSSHLWYHRHQTNLVYNNKTLASIESNNSMIISIHHIQTGVGIQIETPWTVQLIRSITYTISSGHLQSTRPLEAWTILEENNLPSCHWLYYQHSKIRLCCSRYPICRYWTDCQYKAHSLTRSCQVSSLIHGHQPQWNPTVVQLSISEHGSCMHPKCTLFHSSRPQPKWVRSVHCCHYHHQVWIQLQW
jgi:hypothetical protein